MTVVYLALGDRRCTAAARHVADLATAGARVTLIHAAAHLASQVFGPASRRIRSPRAAGARRCAPRAGWCWPATAPARRRPADRRGPGGAGDRLVGPRSVAGPAGCPGTLAGSRAAARRRDVAVVTPWYPSPDDPFAGAFVQATTAAIAPGCGRVSILHTQSLVLLAAAGHRPARRRRRAASGAAVRSRRRARHPARGAD